LRKQRAAERQRRQLRAAQVAKEKEKLIQEQADRERRERELNTKEDERQRREAERRGRLAILKEQHKKEQQALALKKAKEETERRATASLSKEAKGQRRLQLRETHIRRQKEWEEEQLRAELQRALDKEVEKQRREEKLRLQSAEKRKLQSAEKRQKMQEALDAINQIENPTLRNVSSTRLHNVYSPSFASMKTSNPAHFSVPTQSSLFWSLQSDSNIGDSDNYKPALVANAVSIPSSNPQQTNETKKEVPTYSQPSSLASSPMLAHVSTIPCKPVQTCGLSTRTLSTAPSSTATQQNNPVIQSQKI